MAVTWPTGILKKKKMFHLFTHVSPVSLLPKHFYFRRKMEYGGVDQDSSFYIIKKENSTFCRPPSSTLLEIFRYFVFDSKNIFEISDRRELDVGQKVKLSKNQKRIKKG